MAVKDGRERASGAGTDTGTSTDTSTGTSTDTGTSGADSTGTGASDGAGRIIDPLDGGSEEHSGVGADDSRSSDDATDTTRTRTRARSSGGARGSRARTRDGGNANQEARVAEQTLDGVETPRRVKATVDDTVKIPESSRELIGDLWGMLFWIAARISTTPEVELTEPEQIALGDKTEALVKSLGKKRASAALKTLGKFGPVVAFGGTLAGVVVPRVKFVQEKRKRGPIHQTRPQQSAGPRATTEPVAASVGATGGESNSGDTTRSTAREPRAVSFTASDFEEAGAGLPAQGF